MLVKVVGEYMKKKLVIYLFLVSFLLVSCKKSEKEVVVDGNNDMITDTSADTLKDMIVAKSTDEPIRVCVNEFYKNSMMDVVDVWEDMNPGVKIELIVIPQDEEKAKLMMPELKTQIMAGKGPDVFFLMTSDPRYETEYPVLFSDPSKEMSAGIFLPLDDYIERAQYIDMSKYNEVIMNAGKLSDTQYILPYTYDFLLVVYDLAEQVNHESPLILKNTLSGYYSQRLFGDIVDYKNDELMITQDDIINASEYFQETLNQLEQEIGNYIDSPVILETMSDYIFEDLRKIPGNNPTQKDYMFWTMPNVNSGITADIAIYTAVSRYTKQPENAFAFIDFLYRDEAIPPKEGYIGDIKAPPILMNITDGVSVNQRIFKERLSYISEQDKQELFQIQDEINCARFYTDIDRVLNSSLEQIINSEDKATREEVAKTLYDYLWMKSAE